MCELDLYIQTCQFVNVLMQQECSTIGLSMCMFMSVPDVGSHHKNKSVVTVSWWQYMDSSIAKVS